MTREEARKAAEVMLAYANGEEIETICFEDYIPCENPSFNWIDGKGIENYRIKPKPKYRPFKTQEECWNEMLKHQPFGWIYSKNRSCYYCIISVEEDRIELPPREQSRSEGPIKEFYLKNYHYFFDEALELFKITFADGTPFGIKEE